MTAKHLYHAMPMHLHSCHQPGSSMAAHMYNAASLGMRYIWFTDHDIRLGPKRYPCDRFDFSRGTLEYADQNGQTCGWSMIGSPHIRFSEHACHLSFSSDSNEYETCGLFFASSGKRHTASLLADVLLTVGLRARLHGDARILLDVRLSQQPPEHRHAHIVYALGAYETDDPLTAVYALDTCDSVFTLPLSKDATEAIGGIDNAFDTISILLQARRGGQATCAIDRFEISVTHGFEEVLQRQRVLAEKLGTQYGICPFVTTEISGAGPHKNCFTTAVPIIDYAACHYNISHEEAVAHVLRYGGIFAYNHPFEYLKRKTVTREEADVYVLQTADRFLETHAWNASLIEVGFPEGRGLPLSDYLRFWDLLSLNGLFITGYGDSDSHYSDKNWFDGNNFATWTAAAADCDFPVSEETFTCSLKAGRAYMGDPVYIKNCVFSFTAAGQPMGAVIPYKAGDAFEVCFSANGLQDGWQFRIITDGNLFSARTVGTQDTAQLDFSFSFCPTKPVSFVRAELYNADGRCIFLSNPIYWTDTKCAHLIPQERCSLEEKK